MTDTPTPPKMPAKAEPIAVKALHLDPGKPVPGQLSNTITCDPNATNRINHEIWFLPWMRHFQVTRVHPKDGSRTFYIPEGNAVQWEPL